MTGEKKTRKIATGLDPRKVFVVALRYCAGDAFEGFRRAAAEQEPTRTAALDEWKDRWNLSAVPWIIEKAEAVLTDERRGTWVTSFPSLPAFSLEWETWETYEPKVRAAFDQALKEYKKQISDQLERADLTPAKTPLNERDYIWLVRYHVLEQSYKAIAISDEITHWQSVQQDVKALAERIGPFPLSDRRGQRGKNKHKEKEPE